MTRVRAPDSNAYEILGVSPDASAKDIDAAFHGLIDEGGYRVGVPLRGQWLRARQIKEAYAALGDPIKRREYDEALKTGAERPLWPPTPANDPAEAALIRPLEEWRPPPEPTPGPTLAAPGSAEGEPDEGPAGVAESGSGEIDPYDYFGQRAASLDEVSRDEVRYGPAKLWGGTAAAALAIGSLLYFTWPGGNPQLPDAEMAARPPAAAPQASTSAPMTGELAEPPPAAETDGSVGEVRTETSGPDATEAAVPGAAPAQVPAGSQTQTGPGAAAPSGGEASSATAPATQPSPTGQAPTAAEARAAAAPQSVPAGSEAADAPSSPAPRTGPGPAQLIGGGPTRADNPRGRHVGTVVVQFTVQADGRVSNCGAVRSSGKADLDALTCRLVEQRMRFEPARDAQGNPVASTAHARYEWGRRRRHPSLLSWIFR